MPRDLANSACTSARSVCSPARPLIAPFGPLVLLASAIPLTGAVLLMTLGLIGLGAFGVALAERTVKRIARLASVWQLGEGERSVLDGSSPWDSPWSGYTESH